MKNNEKLNIFVTVFQVLLRDRNVTQFVTWTIYIVTNNVMLKNQTVKYILNISLSLHIFRKIPTHFLSNVIIFV